MPQALTILYLVMTNLVLVVKILSIIKEAADKLRNATGAEKHAWVTEKLILLYPKLTSNQIYEWIKAVLYLARLVGVKI